MYMALMACILVCLCFENIYIKKMSTFFLKRTKKQQQQQQFKVLYVLYSTVLLSLTVS